jgi:hypothetical protein
MCHLIDHQLIHHRIGLTVVELIPVAQSLFRRSEASNWSEGRIWYRRSSGQMEIVTIVKKSEFTNLITKEVEGLVCLKFVPDTGGSI